VWHSQALTLVAHLSPARDVAAVGVVIGGGMYFIGFFTVMVSILVLRFGPRSGASDVSVPAS
jgi:uncharacterized membrane protein YhiD involved in acid resistance